MTSLYNEVEPYAADWLVNLATAGHIAPGTVERRSIVDLTPDDVRHATQFHAFAGIGVWSHALGLAGWPDDLPVWTGSCPCQPFSDAGRQKGTADDRHLWPEWFRLIRALQPPVIFGEQVASKAALGWFDAVATDLEGEGYTVWAADLCAAGVGAPHIRQRLYFAAFTVGDATGARLPRRAHEPGDAREELEAAQRASRDAGVVGDTSRTGARRDGGTVPGTQGEGAGERVGAGCVGDSAVDAGAAGFWDDAEWIPCADGKSRPVEPGTFPLAHWAAEGMGRSRTGMLKGYGNAVVAPLAAAFVGAVIDALTDSGYGAADANNGVEAQVDLEPVGDPP